MIYFAVPDETGFLLNHYLDSPWAEPVRRIIRPIPFKELFGQSSLPPCSLIISGYDQLTPAGIEVTTLLWETLTKAGCRVLNHPRQGLRRYELLRSLHDMGKNRFNVFRASEFEGDVRYPVYLHEANQHQGNLSPLLRSPAEVKNALLRARLCGFPLSELLLVEFVDTADENGLYRKYSAYNVDGAILPRHLHTDRKWMVKAGNRVLSRELAEEEERYIFDNPHEAWLREMFEHSNIEYGRADYSLIDGEPQLWEINTAPTIGGRGRVRDRSPEHRRFWEWQLPSKTVFFQKFAQAFQAVDHAGDDGEDIPLNIPPKLLDQWRRETAQRRRVRARQRFMLGFLETSVAGAVRPLIDPIVTRISRLAGA